MIVPFFRLLPQIYPSTVQARERFFKPLLHEMPFFRIVKRAGSLLQSDIEGQTFLPDSRSTY